MYRVELYARVRRACHVEGMSTREASRVFGVDRKTVRKMLSFSVPPGYRRSAPPRRPKLGPFTGIIDRILEDDRTSHRKQRHTAKRIFDRLRDEYGFTGGYTIVKDYVREQGLRSREVFVPLSHSPGHAQADFGEAMAVIGGALRKIHFLAFDLPHSDGCFVAAYPAETTEAFCDGHNAAFAFFGGVPRSILYDNTKLAVARILGDGSGSERASSRSFSPTICSRTGSAGRARATTRARSRDWSVSSGGTSWSPSRGPRASRPSTMLSRDSAAGARRRGCGATRRPSASVSSGIVKFSCHCRLLPMMPAISALDGRVRCRWCVTAATTIPCPWPTATVRCSSGATSMRW